MHFDFHSCIPRDPVTLEVGLDRSQPLSGEPDTPYLNVVLETTFLYSIVDPETLSKVTNIKARQITRRGPIGYKTSTKKIKVVKNFSLYMRATTRRERRSDTKVPTEVQLWIAKASRTEETRQSPTVGEGEEVSDGERFRRRDKIKATLTELTLAAQRRIP